MASFREGKVTQIVDRAPDIVRALVQIEGGEIAAVGYPFMLGPLAGGDRVIVNATGLDLHLGTGGAAFILWNLDGRAPSLGRGHIVKMRYTPWQTEVDAVEAPESPHHDVLEQVRSIDGMPVVVAGLHSQVSAMAAGLKRIKPSARLGYLMTDGGALAIAWSNLVRELKSAGLLDVTATAGHAFGGDLEVVNVFSGLAALKTVAEVDAVVIAMGPGVAGTGTALGFTAMEQGQALDAAGALGGRSIAAVRLSFVDERERHRGISHHTLTALQLAARARTTVVLPELPQEEARRVRDQMVEAGITDRHEVVVVDGAPGVEELRDRGVKPTSMGRSLDQQPELFLAGAAAGAHAAGLL